MRKITVEAFEDESRPQGGHAVILLHGLENVPHGTTFRLRPVDASQHTDHRAWRNTAVAPITTRVTDRGVEFVVGPEVVSNPMLLSGTPVVIELPDAGVRGEFLWPNVAPLAPPRRRHLVVPRRPRRETSAIALPPELPSHGERPYRNGNGAAGAHAYAGSSNGFHAEPHFRSDAPTSAVVVPLRPETVREPVVEPVPEAEPAPVMEMKTHVEEGVILDVLPTLVEVAGEAVTSVPPPIPAVSGVVDAKVPVWDEPLRRGKADTLNWTPGKEPLGTAGARILYGVAAVAVTLGAAVYVMSGRDAKPAAPTMAAPAAKLAAPAQGGGAGAGAPVSPPSAGGPDGKGSAAAAITAAPAMKPAAPVCPPTPEVATEPLAGGRMKLSVKAACRGGQEIKLGYGGASFRYKLDADGALATVVDCFAGTKEPLELQLADGSRTSVPVTALDLDRVTKIAVVWRAPVNLDLHAFEYAALPGSKGHVWAGSPATAAVAQEVIADKRGHGFISTADGGQSLGDKIEVYTFFHNDEQASGAVAMALDYATRGEMPAEPQCGKGPLAEIPYWVGVSKRGGQMTRENGIIAAAACGTKIGADVRFGQSTLPVIRIKK